MIQRTMYVPAVADLERSAEFYRDVLGFEIQEIGDPGWRMFTREECRIMAGHCPDAKSPAELGDHSYFGYLVVDDADALFAEFSGKGAEIPCPPTDEPWGMREFSVHTIDGHRIMFGQPL